VHRIFIDPSSRIRYSSFYIKGLEDVFGKKYISFSSKYFKDLKRKTESHSYDHYMAFVLLKDDNIQKIVIDFRDKISVKERAYDWCDKYAKINYNKNLTEGRLRQKIISIPPGFGIQIWGFWETFFYSFANLLRCRFSPLVNLKKHFVDYLGQYLRRARIETYYKKNIIVQNLQTIKSEKQYVFFIATLWTHDNCLVGTNLLRKKFIESCKLNQQIEFEGGFFANSSILNMKNLKKLFFQPVIRLITIFTTLFYLHLYLTHQRFTIVMDGNWENF
jgi:hypothetical protein